MVAHAMKPIPCTINGAKMVKVREVSVRQRVTGQHEDYLVGLCFRVELELQLSTRQTNFAVSYVSSLANRAL